MKYYTTAKQDNQGNVILYEMYESLLLQSGRHYLAYVHDESKVKNDFIFKYTNEDNIRELIEI